MKESKWEKKEDMCVYKCAFDSNAEKMGRREYTSKTERDSHSQILNIAHRIARRFICYFEMRNVHQLEMNDVCLCVNLCISFETVSYWIQINRCINDYIIWVVR